MKDLSKVYKEVNIILDLLSVNHSSRVPQAMKNFFVEHQDNNYNPNITLDNLFNHTVQPETVSIITILYIKYWTENENEKEKLMSIIRKYDEEQREKSLNIFKTENNKKE